MDHVCPHCGAPLAEGASFCPHCAQSIRAPEPIQVPKPRRRFPWVVALILVVVIAAGGWYFFGRNPASETVPVIVEENEDGKCVVDADLMRSYFPEVTYINFGTTSLTSDNIDDYLINSFQMAQLVSSRGTTGSDGEHGSFNADKAPGSRLCLLLFDRNTHLMGYFLGEAQQVADGQWQMDVVPCDYDFTDLYEEQLAAFEAGWEEMFSNYIAPEDFESAGVTWFLKGLNTGRGPELREDDSQLYHLWITANSPEPERQFREIERLEESLPNEGRWMCYLLFDSNDQLLGYTMLDSQGNG